MSRGGNAAHGLAGAYAGGRNRVDEIIEDRRRVDFINRVCKCPDVYVMLMDEHQQKFCERIALENDGKTVFNLHPGDRNIIDSLRRKYESKLP